jgi:CubicO group peptidase (beta-lactamase class C family)
MFRFLTAFVFVLTSATFAFGQNLYFPPLTGSTWETTGPQSLGWCTDAIPPLYDFLEKNNTKAFLLLKDGKIVLEKYFGTFTQDSVWYWASAGKTLTGFTVGIAQQEGLLGLSDSSSQYLGKGWTSLTPAQEGKITVRHQITMTTGLRDGAPDNDCTLPNCLVYAADPGTRWAYHNAPYTLLDKVVEAASKQTFNTYVATRVLSKTGMKGVFIKSGYNNIFFSNARSMARFGLLLLNKGRWSNTTVLSDTAYLRRMTNSSQTLNPSYGYLTWLNGKGRLMVPSSQIVFPTDLSPSAPDDMYAAMGKNGQFLNVVPSQNLVWVRMGNVPDNSLVPFTLNEDIWQRLLPVMCTSVDTKETIPPTSIAVYPNPTGGVCAVNTIHRDQHYALVNQWGQILEQGSVLPSTIDLISYPAGLYWLRTEEGGVKILRF